MRFATAAYAANAAVSNWFVKGGLFMAYSHEAIVSPTMNRHSTTLAAIILAFTCCSMAEEPKRPNVILMMADDLGYGDLSGYGSKLNRTPVLDSLAANGLRLTDYHSGNSVCTPSRMALMTGCYPARVGWPGGVLGYRMNADAGLSSDAYTVAEVFKDAGYKTALIGKWHLGSHADRLPNAQGFDETFYIKMSNNQTKKLWRNDKLEMDPFDNKRLTEHFINESIEFIKRNEGNPFFLYLPFTAPHFPVEAHPDWDGKSKNGAYGDVVEELDHRIGEMMKVLKELKIDQNTIVIFTSDNGPQPTKRKFITTALPYRGEKWNSLEGGNRVPCIIHWPAALPKGVTYENLTGSIDIMPTLAAACGIEIDPEKSPVPIDGVSIIDALKGKSEHPRQHLLLWNGWATPQAIRQGHWKLYFDEDKLIPGSENGPVLYDLKNDIFEQTNVADQHPEMVKKLLIKAQESLSEIHSKSIPLGGKDDSPKAKAPKWLNKPTSSR